MRILLATDGSPSSNLAVEEVGRRQWPQGSEIKVLSAFELPLPPTPEAWAIPPAYFEELDSAARNHSRSIVESAVEKVRAAQGPSLPVTALYVQGAPREAILDEAERWQADLIVVGSHGYRAWERFLLGSVSQAVVSHAKCSVEVVRCREQPKKENS